MLVSPWYRQLTRPKWHLGRPVSPENAWSAKSGPNSLWDGMNLSSIPRLQDRQFFGSRIPAPSALITPSESLSSLLNSQHRRGIHRANMIVAPDPSSRTGLIAFALALGFAASGCDRLWGSPDQRVEILEHRIAQLEGKGSVGRYQVVDPTPGVVRNALLLDTVTGHTWIACTIVGDGGKPIEGTESNGWCSMSQAAGRGND